MSIPNTIKLQKAIAMMTGQSRRQAESLIADKKVKVNQKTAKIGQRVDLNKDSITLVDKLISQPKELIYLTIYKPKEVITSRHDELGRKTIMKLVPQKYQHLFPVGRLDYESEGLVLLTNDGDLAYRLTHPKFAIEKTYEVKPDRRVSLSAFFHLKKGMLVAKRKIIPKSVERMSDGWLRITLTSGQKHVVRKLLKHAGYEVEILKRVSFGPFSLDSLKPGEWCEVDNNFYLKNER